MNVTHYWIIDSSARDGRPVIKIESLIWSEEWTRKDSCGISSYIFSVLRINAQTNSCFIEFEMWSYVLAINQSNLCLRFYSPFIILKLYLKLFGLVCLEKEQWAIWTLNLVHGTVGKTIGFGTGTCELRNRDTMAWIYTENRDPEKWIGTQKV